MTATKKTPETKAQAKNNGAKINKNCRAILNALAKGKPLTRQGIAQAFARAGGKLHSTGRLNNESAAYQELLDTKAISPKVLDIDGVKETRYSLTAKGQKLAAAK